MSYSRWITVCEFDGLTPDVGVRARLGDKQVAIFRLSGTDKVHAIDALDPFSQVNVLSYGIVGDTNGRDVVASPIYKQHFCLETGECLEDNSVKIKTYPVRRIGGLVEVKVNVLKADLAAAGKD